MVSNSGFPAFQECLRCRDPIFFTMLSSVDVEIPNQKVVVEWVLHGPSFSMPRTVIDLTVGTSMSCHARPATSCCSLESLPRRGFETDTAHVFGDLWGVSRACLEGNWSRWISVAVKETNGGRWKLRQKMAVARTEGPCASSTSILSPKMSRWLWSQFPTDACWQTKIVKQQLWPTIRL